MEMAVRVVWGRGLAVTMGQAYNNVSLVWQMPWAEATWEQCSVGTEGENSPAQGLPSHQPPTLTLTCTTLSQAWALEWGWVLHQCPSVNID